MGTSFHGKKSSRQLTQNKETLPTRLQFSLHYVDTLRVAYRQRLDE